MKKIIFALLAASAILAAAFADAAYTVQKGDTLYSISRKYELTVGELRAANNLGEGDVLKAGQRLVIPSADISSAAALSASPAKAEDGAKAASGAKAAAYTARKGDTLYGIALKHGMKLSELLALNGMGSDAIIKVGQKILVDGGAKKTAAPEQQKSGAKSAAQPQRGDSNLLWPVSNPSVTYVKGKVSGVDLSADAKEDVKSIRAGTVMYTGVYRGYGSVVFVESKTGLIYAYTKLGSVSVKKGDYVVCGDTVGSAGGASGKNGLTLMVFKNGSPMDPAKAPRG